MVDRKILTKKLWELGIQDETLKWFESFLSDRTQFVEIDGIKSSNYTTTRGVVQGSSTSSTLFLCYVNSLGSLKLYGNMYMYADDIALTYSHQNMKNVEEMINIDLITIKNWMEKHKLLLNTKKTKAMIFSTTNLIQNEIKICLDGSQIEIVDNFKYLGINIDSKLNWDYHLKELNKN